MTTFFLATKTGERERGPAHDQIRRSLERMGVDTIDLLQLHNLVDRAEWEVAMGPGGALEAAVEARDEGIVRFIGVTGHGLDVAERHLQSLEEFAFDSVLFPYNYAQLQNDEHAAQVEELDRDLRGPRRRDPDDQERVQGSLGRSRPSLRAVVRADHRSRTRSTRPSPGRWRGPASS